jgi:arylsulfatase A-like enzyme
VGSPPGGYFSPFDNPNLEDREPGECLPLRLSRETVSFLESAGDAPFLAYLSFYSVHGPIETSRHRWERFRKKAVAQGAPDRRFEFGGRLPVRQVQDCPIYAGMIEAMDEGVGLVLDALDRLGLAENTIVIFTSDNGGVCSGDSYPSSMLPLRGGKGIQWEGGTREPLYVRYPGEVAAASECDVPVSGIDFYPTLLDLAGVPVPGEQDVDGVSIAKLLRGVDDESVGGRDLYWHYPHYGNQGGDPSSTIRRGDWKLIHYYEDGHDELYNLSTDPGEQNDVAAQDSEKVNLLRARLDGWLAETGAKFPTSDPEHDPEQENAYLERMRTEKMAELEKQHAAYLDPEWQPNDDWWGSQITTD